MRVIGPPFFICSLNFGITEPEESSTLPNLTIENFVLAFLSDEILCLSFKAYPYKRSFDIKAKSGLQRIEQKLEN